MLDNSNDGITANENGAYAVLMTDEEELERGTGEVVFYNASFRDPGKFWLLKNLTSRAPVRVLRTWKLRSTLAPTAGIRYDGL